jgi:hypothetical protein
MKEKSYDEKEGLDKDKEVDEKKNLYEYSVDYEVDN